LSLTVHGPGFDFNDVLLIPRHSTIDSRFTGEIDLSVQLLPNLKLQYPIISANMDTVTEWKMAKTLWDIGGLGIIHRFMKPEFQVAQIEATGFTAIHGVCIGIGEGGLDRLKYIQDNCSVTIESVLIDVAHGDSRAVVDQIKALTAMGIPSIAGNVATASGAITLADAGASSVKVGVGPGAACTTRLNTGAGVYQLTAISDCYDRLSLQGYDTTIIADGGIKAAGDIVKALAAGADAVMIGNMFAGTDEAPGRPMDRGKGMVKTYRGMSSRSAQENWKGSATSIEGESFEVYYRGSVVPIFQDMVANILSGMSYQNALNLSALRTSAEFVARY
jgi:IMP dehydrogenase